MHKKICLFVAIVLLHASAWAVNKCTEPDGQVSFQDAPCSLSTKTAEKLKLPFVQPTTEEDSRINAAIAAQRIRIGMTAQHVRRSWGEPTKINLSVGSYGKNEQWIYERGDFVSQYIYLQNGIVTSAQSPKEK